MLVNCDAKALEWMVALYLSRDKVGMQEWMEGTDQHADNQKRFNLPTRTIAKIFVFRLIYGGGAYSYANDANFMGVSTDQKFWQGVIDAFYLKYEGIHRWHDGLVEEVMRSGRIVVPSGRIFTFAPIPRTGEWPRTTILNYPVQGLSADLMVLARCLLWRKLRAYPQIKWLSTVHDSILFDVPTDLVSFLAEKIFETWDELPAFFEATFGVAWDLPCRVEVSSGPNWKDQKEIKRAELLCN